MRLQEFRTEEEQLDEILPLIPAIAGGVARAAIGGAGKLAGKAALGVGKAAARGAAKGVGALARGATRAVGLGRRDDDEEEPQTNNPNATVGTQPAATPNAEPMGAADDNTGTATDSTGKAAPTASASTELRTGATVDLPTKTPGGKKAFKVTRAQGDDIEIEDPQAKPGEPRRMVYNKDDLAAAMKQ